MGNYREERPGSFVNALRGLITNAQQARTHEVRPLEQASPASIIHYELDREVFRQRHRLHDEQKAAFFETLSIAWSALAVEAYSSDITKDDAYDALYFTHKRALERHDPNAGVIPLTPEQTQLIDILSETANISNRQRGLPYVPIPPKGRRANY
jgi:hypothetical protein